MNKLVTSGRASCSGLRVTATQVSWSSTSALLAINIRELGASLILCESVCECVSVCVCVCVCVCEFNPHQWLLSINQYPYLDMTPTAFSSR